MPSSTSPQYERLPRGRHGIDPAVVRRQQTVRAKRAMLDEVAAFGYEATTVGDICRRAGISRETFYRSFSDRSACFEAAIADVREALEDAVAGVEPGPTPVATVRRAMDALRAAAEADPAGVRSLLDEVPPRLECGRRQRGMLIEGGVRWLQQLLRTEDRLECLTVLTLVRTAAVAPGAGSTAAADAVVSMVPALWPHAAQPA